MLLKLQSRPLLRVERGQNALLKQPRSSRLTLRVTTDLQQFRQEAVVQARVVGAAIGQIVPVPDDSGDVEARAVLDTFGASGEVPPGCSGHPVGRTVQGAPEHNNQGERRATPEDVG